MKNDQPIDSAAQRNKRTIILLRERFI